MHAWWSEVRSRALLRRSEAAPGTVGSWNSPLGSPECGRCTSGRFFPGVRHSSVLEFRMHVNRIHVPRYCAYLRLVCLDGLVASSRQQAAAAAAQQQQGHGRTSTHTIKLCCIPVCEASNTARLERHSPSIRRPFGSASLRLRTAAYLDHVP